MSTERQVSPSPSHGTGMLCTAPDLRAAHQGRWLTVGSSSKEQEEQEEQQGPLQTWVAPEAWRKERCLRTAATFHHLWMGARGRAKTPTTPKGASPFQGPAGFPYTSPMLASPPQHTHLEKGALSRREAVPVRRRQAPASPENSHPMNRTARRKNKPQEGPDRCPLPAQGWHHKGIKPLHPNRG